MPHRLFSKVLVSLSLPLLFLGPSTGLERSGRVFSQEAFLSTPGDHLVVRVQFPNRSVLNDLARFLDIFEVNHAEGYLVAMVTREEYDGLQRRGLPLEIDAPYTERVNRPYRKDLLRTETVPNYSCYRTVDETYAAMQQLATGFPNLASWVDIGDSWEKAYYGGASGKDLRVLVLTNKSRPAAGKFRFFLMGAIHAREMAAGELASRFAEVVANGYGSNADITWLLDYSEIHILPLGNPDGRKWADQLYWQRKNTNINNNACTMYNPPFWNTQIGTDLNRNSPSHWDGPGSSTLPCADTYRGSSPGSEPETQAIQDYIRSLFPDQRGPGEDDPAPPETTGLFITLHCYGNLVMYPWGWTDKKCPNQPALQTLARKFAFSNRYYVQQAVGLYATNGATDDWSYEELGIASYTFEVGRDFFDYCTLFENTIWRDNLGALLYAAKSARRPYQNPAGPELFNAEAINGAVLPGGAIQIDAIADDTRYYSGSQSEPAQAIQEARYSVDAPSWVSGTTLYSMTARDGFFNSSQETVEAWVDTTGWTPGRHLIFMEAKDADGNWGSPSAVFVTILGPNVIWLPMVLHS